MTDDELIAQAETALNANWTAQRLRGLVRKLVAALKIKDEALKAAQAENERLRAEMQRAINEGDWA